MISNWCKIIAQSRYCQYVVKFSEELSSTECLNFLKKIIFSTHTNPDFVHLTYVKSQLLSIVHDIYASFDQIPTLERRENFQDISEAFDKVWHEGLLFKLEHIGISGNLLNVLKSFINNRFQRVVLNGQSSNWSSVLAGVPQGFILGPLLSMIFLTA